MSSKPEMGFADSMFLFIDRIERTLADLKDQARAADEYLLMAHAQVNEVMARKGPGLPHVTVDNQMPQSIGVQGGWADDGTFVVRIHHRGEEGVPLLPPSTQMEIEV